MRLIFYFCQLSSGKYPRWYGIEENDLPAIDYAIIESVATAVQKLRCAVVQAALPLTRIFRQISHS
jgi:hypothetical protein